MSNSHQTLGHKIFNHPGIETYFAHCAIVNLSMINNCLYALINFFIKQQDKEPLTFYEGFKHISFKSNNEIRT